MKSTNDWLTGADAWDAFVKQHPELGYRGGKWPFHNFLRFHRSTLQSHDAIRLARRKHWIAHRERFLLIAFECATGAAQESLPVENSPAFPIGTV